MAGLKRVTDAIKAERRKEAFRRKCLKVSESTGIEVSFCDDDRKQEPHEDDGTLHITKDGLRACFWVCSDVPAVQNERAVEVMTAMKMEKKITDRVLVEDDEDSNDLGDRCPHCGHDL